VTSAQAVHSTTWVYSIGYAIGNDECQKNGLSGDELPAITPVQALTQIASNPGNYFNRPDAGQLNTIFTSIAADISQGVSKLID
jgi:hypothetical protein